MKEYRKVAEFSYYNNSYIMYLDNKNKHFFLRKYNGKLYYVSVPELMVLTDLFTNMPNIMNAKKDSSKRFMIIPKVLASAILVPLSTMIITTSVNMYNSSQRINAHLSQSTEFAIIDEEKATDYLAYEDPQEKHPKELVVDTYIQNEKANNLYIYDMDYLDLLFDYQITPQDIIQTIDNNPNVSPMYKEILKDYVIRVSTKHPDAELRVLGENLKDIEVVECEKSELIKHTLSPDAFACYVRSENKIYVLKGNEYKPGTWEYQVIYHEISHALRTLYRNLTQGKIRVQAAGQNFSNLTTEEALNSLFTVSLFDYDEQDVAYQLQSNYHSVIIECLDNYTLTDYVNHSLSYYASKMDEQTGEKNYATVILELIQLQYDAYHKPSLNFDKASFYPIYEYIQNLYYSKYITADMSYDDVTVLTDALIERITFDVPEEYEIDINHFYEYQDIYCRNNGIAVRGR